MSSAIISSIAAIGIGILLVVAGEKFTPFFSFFPGNVGASIIGGLSLFPLLGMLLTAVGVIFLIFGVLLKFLYRKKPQVIQKAEEVKEKKIYVSPFDGAKFESEEALDNYIKENYSNVIKNRQKLEAALRGDRTNG